MTTSYGGPRVIDLRPDRAQAVKVLADLVAVGDIAKRTGLAVSTVWNWPGRYADFPAPLGRLAAANVYWWPEVQAWLAMTGRQAS